VAISDAPHDISFCPCLLSTQILQMRNAFIGTKLIRGCREGQPNREAANLMGIRHESRRLLGAIAQPSLVFCSA
jgi:hypothetical protein